MKLTLLLFFHFSLLTINAQNLVLNSSFEDYKYCPELISNFNNNVTHWSTPTLGTTDYFNICSDRMKFINHAGSQNPRTGNGYVGIYVYSQDNYKEYIQGQLRQVLEHGKTYKISFYLSLSEYSTHAFKNIDVLFTSKLLFKGVDDEINIKKLSKEALLFNYIPAKNEMFYSDKKAWIKVEFDYVAKGFENYFSIGNFNKNRKQKKQKMLQSSGKQFSYYYIDDVSVELIKKDQPKEVKEVEKQTGLPLLENNKTYAFKNVLFDIDKAELLESSEIELDKLFNYLKSKINLVVHIYGHTDNSGLEKRNKELSKQRAKAVVNYLISQGLESSRITSFGFGSSQPISNNTTEEGRQQNRRVEFKLIEN